MVEKEFVGSKYLETLGGALDLVKIIYEDLNLCVKNGEIPKGTYNIKAYETPCGDLLEINAYLDESYNMNSKKINKVRKNIENIADDYNRVKRVESFMEKDRRFYHEVNIY